MHSTGQVSLDVGDWGIGTSSLPYGQVVTNHIVAFALTSGANARVCLNMQSTGNDTRTMELGTMSIGGQTLIRLDVQPVHATRPISLSGSTASLLIGPNASLCY